jgi:SAM-dependent methyltransferase
MSDPQLFWERPDQVETFAEREADRRLVDLLDEFAEPGKTRVLDLGCAGGRNTVVLAERGFDVHALDASAAMVQKTRERLAELLGIQEAERRVRLGKMDDLGDYPAEFFQLTVALGVYHSAASSEEWDRALKETARVLVHDGKLLVANFSPRCESLAEELRCVEGERHVYEGHAAGPMFLVEADDLDAEMRGHGLVPMVASETVFAQSEKGRRVTVNALYQKRRD